MVVALSGVLLLLGLAAYAAEGAPVADRWPVVKKFFPTATRFGDIEGKPPAATVYQDKKIIGYVFESKMIAPVPAYSGKPVNVLIGVDTKGQITGTKVLEQEEPILLVGIPVQKLYDFVNRYVGHRVTEDIVVGGGAAKKGQVHIDAISSATVTSLVVNQTILRAAMEVAVSRKLVSPSALAAGPAKVRMDVYHKATWRELTGNGSIRRLLVTREMVAKAFKDQRGEVQNDIVTNVPAGLDPNTFIELYYAYLNAPTIGRSLLGANQYSELMHRLEPGMHAVAVMANGVYSFKGLGYVRGGIFDRLHLVQNNQLILFHDSDYQTLVDLGLADAPHFSEMTIFIIRKAYDFDPGSPWQLQLLVRRQIGPLKSIFTTFNAGYQIPSDYVTRPAAPSSTALSPTEPLWVTVWKQRKVDIAILVLGLVALSAILMFQDWLIRRPKLLSYLRNGFLVYTVFFIGWYSLGQLSVVNVLTFVHAMFQQFRWDAFLIDPMLFILWTFVAVTLLMVGRGVYCGWLCPYGAMQTLISKIAQRFHVPQIEVPPLVHERLWAVKYIILLVLFGLSLQSVGLAERYAEVEPFKTAVNLHFARQWGFVFYAVGLLVISAFNSKFYCKYVCPLGAALAISGRYRLFEWLRRRRECGRPCQVCAVECEVKAINPIGAINFNECHYCLDCQVTYWNDQKCPPLVERRKRREKRERVHEQAGGDESVPVPIQGPSKLSDDGNRTSST